MSNWTAFSLGMCVAAVAQLILVKLGHYAGSKQLRRDFDEQYKRIDAYLEQEVAKQEEERSRWKEYLRKHGCEDDA